VVLALGVNSIRLHVFACASATIRGVRWDALFDDLEGQLAAAGSAELAAEVSDRSRRELARVRLSGRAQANLGAELTVRVAGVGPLRGALRRQGPDWWLLGEASAEHLVPTAAIEWVVGLSAAGRDPDEESVVAARLGLGYVLRAIARDRATVAVSLRGGETLTGTVDGVGSDFIDVAEHALGEARRAANVRAVRTVPVHALAVIRLV